MIFKVVASKAGNIVFDERVEAESPREARRAMKKALGLQSLAGVVYAITEIPMALIEEIVAEKIAGMMMRRGRIDPGKLMREAAEAALKNELAPIKNRLIALEGRRGNEGAGMSGNVDEAKKRFDPVAATHPPPIERQELPRAFPAELRAILGPDWKVIRRHYAKTHSVKQTAAQFDVPINTLKSRIRREKWGRK